MNSVAETTALREAERAILIKRGVSPLILRAFDNRTTILVHAARAQDRRASEALS